MLQRRASCRPIGSAVGVAQLDTPVQLVNGLQLLGVSDAVQGSEIDLTVRALFVFDKDFRLLNMEILQAAAEDPCS